MWSRNHSTTQKSTKLKQLLYTSIAFRGRCHMILYTMSLNNAIIWYPSYFQSRYQIPTNQVSSHKVSWTSGHDVFTLLCENGEHDLGYYETNIKPLKWLFWAGNYTALWIRDHKGSFAPYLQSHALENVNLLNSSFSFFLHFTGWRQARACVVR
jgi:hypothetical protein